MTRVTGSAVRYRGPRPLRPALRQFPPGGAAGEQAAAEERALERAVAVHPAAAEAGHLAGRVQAGQRLAVGAQHARGEVGLQAAERLAREDVQLARRSAGRPWGRAGGAAWRRA